MTTVKGPGGIEILRFPESQIGNAPSQWKLKTTQSHILHSKCSQDEITCATSPCDFCVFSKTLQLRHFPDMVFPNNIMRLEHESGAVIEFNALDALKRVVNDEINIRLPYAEAWKASRSDCKEYLKEKMKPFDWTFTTDYMGTVSGFEIEETEDQIDFHHLTKRNAIVDYRELTLFEDEVHDCGTASLSVKIRVMEDCLFVLLRYFLRVDHSMIRINDTRLYHHFSKPYLLREYTSRESEIRDLEIPPSLLIEPSLIAPQIPLKHSYYHKLIIPTKSENTTNDIVQCIKTNNEENAKHMGESSNSISQILE